MASGELRCFTAALDGYTGSWDGSIELPRWLSADGSVLYLRHVDSVGSSLQIEVSATPSGSISNREDLNDDWEVYDQAIEFNKDGAEALFLKGPNNPDNIFAEGTEPYFWTPDNGLAMASYLTEPISGLTITFRDGQSAGAELNPVEATAAVGRPRALVQVRPAPVVADASPGRPRVDVQAHAVAVETRPSVARPRIIVRARPGALSVTATVSNPKVGTIAQPSPIPVTVDIGRPNAIFTTVRSSPTSVSTAVGSPRAIFTVAAPSVMRVRATVRQAAAIHRARLSPITANVSVGRPAHRSAARPEAVVARPTVGSPQVIFTTAGPSAIRARATVARPLIIVRPRPADRSLVGRDNVWALEITHPMVNPPARVVADTVQHRIEGSVFHPVAFEAEIVSSTEGEIPRASLRVDNVGREMMEWVEASQGGRDVRMTVMRVRPPLDEDGNSTVLERRTLPVTISEVDNLSIRVTLAYDLSFDRPSVIMRHDPTTSPGLF